MDLSPGPVDDQADRKAGGSAGPRPAAGTVINVSCRNGSTSLQVTTGGHARWNGNRIELIAEVEDYAPQQANQNPQRALCPAITPGIRRTS